MLEKIERAGWHGEDDNLSRAALPAYTKTEFCGYASLRHRTLTLGNGPSGPRVSNVFPPYNGQFAATRLLVENGALGKSSLRYIEIRTY